MIYVYPQFLMVKHVHNQRWIFIFGAV